MTLGHGEYVIKSLLSPELLPHIQNRFSDEDIDVPETINENLENIIITAS